MTVTEGISDEAFRALVEHAGLNPTPEDLASLRALYEHFYEGLKSMHAMELGEEDLAVMYPAVWEPDPPQDAQ